MDKSIEALKKAAETSETYCSIGSNDLAAVCAKLPENKTAQKLLAVAKGSAAHGGKAMMIPTAFAKEFLAEVSGGPVQQ